jgi:hypothetical protein
MKKIFFVVGLLKFSAPAVMIIILVQSPRRYDRYYDSVQCPREVCIVAYLGP